MLVIEVGEKRFEFLNASFGWVALDGELLNIAIIDDVLAIQFLTVSVIENVLIRLEPEAVAVDVGKPLFIS